MDRSTVDQNTILLVNAGSHAYGTSTPTSDRDVRGVMTPPADCVIGMNRVEQFEQKGDPDIVVYELRKYLALAADCNPNIIEVVFTDDSDVLTVTPIGQRLRAARRMFISTKAKFTFSGYAISQLNRIESHRRWLMTPPDAPPVRAEFGLPERTVIPKDQLAAAEAMMRKQVEAWENTLPTFGVDVLDPAAQIEMRDKVIATLTEIRAATDDERMLAAGRVLGLDSNFLDLLDRERRYITKRREWDAYRQWQNGRNQARAELERQHGYDCYLDDTEFLTELGWRRYDEISDELRLATLNQTTAVIEYQTPTERVSRRYSGPICFFETQDMACAVTPNHRMWASETRGGKSNKSGTTYSEARAGWKIIRAEDMLNGRRYSFHVRTAGAGSTLSKDDHTLIIVGAYVSEGCVGKRLKNGDPSVLHFSQKSGGRQEPYLERLLAARNDMRKYPIRRHERWRKNSIIENVYTLADRTIAREVALECGEGSNAKRLPKWALALSLENARFLLDVLMSGDGTARRFSRIYYTSSRGLADDVQALAVIAGFTSKTWGPYPDKRNPTLAMYHVYVGRSAFSRVITKGEQSHVEIEHVSDRRIVCFTVPNEVLITRRNGKVAVQGNTKHGMHLVRLMQMCEEILTTGEVRVRRPNAAELLDIRGGAWSYDKLIGWAKEQDALMDELYKSSTLPHSPDRKAINALCMELISESLGVRAYCMAESDVLPPGRA